MRIFIVTILLTFLAACGQKGPLTLPPDSGKDASTTPTDNEDSRETNEREEEL